MVMTITFLLGTLSRLESRLSVYANIGRIFTRRRCLGGLIHPLTAEYYIDHLSRPGSLIVGRSCGL
jgi:hypothetical protein